MKLRLETWIFILITILFAFYVVESTQPKAMTEDTESIIIVKSSDNKVYSSGSDAFVRIGDKRLLDIDILKNDLGIQFKYQEKYSMGIVTTPHSVIRFKDEGVYINNKESNLTNLVKANGRKYIDIDQYSELLGIKIDIIEEKIILRSKATDTVVGTTTSEYPVRLKSSKSIFARITRIISDTDVQILDRDGHWIYVMLRDGTFGYIRRMDIASYDEITGEAVDIKEPIWKPEEKIILSWEYDGKSRLNANKIKGLKGVDVTSPTWFSVSDTKGSIRGKVNKGYIKWAKAKGYKIWPLITNSFDPDITHGFLSDAKTRESIINKLLKIMRDNDLDGINLDFENIYLKDKDNLVQFVREITPVFNEHGLVVSMDVTVMGGSDTWSRCFDRKELGKVLDYMAVMTYDEHWASSPKAGSVASLDWVEDSLSRIMNDVPSEKILMGIPFYTRIWTEEKTADGSIKLKSKAVSMPYVEKLIKSKGLEKQWLDNIGQYYVEYSEGNKRYRIWIEDAKSIDLKAGLVDKLNISGVATWRRGFETLDIWEILDSRVN